MIKEKKLPVIPLGDKVLVEMILTNLSTGGVYLTEKEGQSGYIRSIGQGVHEMYLGERLNMIKNSRGIALGDKVCIPRGLSAGQQFVENVEGEEEKHIVYLLVPIGHITCVVN